MLQVSKNVALRLAANHKFPICFLVLIWITFLLVQAPSVAVKEAWVEQVKSVLMTQFDVIKGQRKKVIPVKPIAG